MAPRETENNAYAKFWGDKQRALWYVMVFSGVVNLRVFAYITRDYESAAEATEQTSEVASQSFLRQIFIIKDNKMRL